MCSEIQDIFLRLALATGSGASKVALMADFGTRSIAVRVFKEKFLLVFHIRSLEDTALAKMMLREQLDNNWPGPVREAKVKCECIGVEDVNVTTLDKAKYTKIVEEACRAKDEVDMKREMTEKVEEKSSEGSWSKLKRMVMDDCKMKDCQDREHLHCKKDLEGQGLHAQGSRQLQGKQAVRVQQVAGGPRIPRPLLRLQQPPAGQGPGQRHGAG